MPAPANGHHEQAKLALVAAVAQILGPASDYHLGPTRAFATHAYKKTFWSQDEVLLWHAVRAGITPINRETTCDDEHIAEFFILACARHEVGETEKEWLADGEVAYTTLQNKMLDDLEHALENAPDRAGNPLHSGIAATDGYPIADRLLFVEVNRDFIGPKGWCCLELRMELTYHKPTRRV